MEPELRLLRRPFRRTLVDFVEKHVLRNSSIVSSGVGVETDSLLLRHRFIFLPLEDPPLVRSSGHDFGFLSLLDLVVIVARSSSDEALFDLVLLEDFFFFFSDAPSEADLKMSGSDLVGVKGLRPAFLCREEDVESSAVIDVAHCCRLLLLLSSAFIVMLSLRFALRYRTRLSFVR
jgi:hypothetical protein